MKVTKRQLRRIIREYSSGAAHPRGDLGKNIADADFPIVVGYEGRSEIAYNQEELDDILDDVAPLRGGAGIPYSLDSLADMEPQDVPVGAGIEQYREGKMRITKRQLRQIIREAEQLQLPFKSAPDKEYEYGEFARTPEVQAMLVAAGFNADGSFGMDGYPGPADWQMYSPETMEAAEGWVDAAIEMNDALRKAEKALDRGDMGHGEDAFFNIVYPVQRKWSKHGASDTEGREVAGDWLEKAGYEW
jgi:hypothetical protein